MTHPAPEKPQILIVDDSKVIRMAAKKMLCNDYVIQLAEDGQQGWEYVQQHTDVLVVFTDLSMPRMDGMALLKRIRESGEDRLINLPVVILTGAEDNETVKKQAMDAGATDFVLKPFDSIDLISRAKAYAQLSRKVIELEASSAYDKLTGLYTARSLYEQGSKAISFSQRHHLCISLCVFEVKDIQAYFLKFGKKVAQTILITVVKRMRDLMRKEDIAARLDLSRFALILPLTDEQKTRIVVERIQQNIRKLVFEIGGNKIQLVMNCGITTSNMAKPVSIKQLLQQAETALKGLGCTKTMQLAYYSGDQGVKGNSGVDLSEKEMEQAFGYIMRGEYDRLSEQSISLMAKQLSAFMQYVDERHANASVPENKAEN